ncbi:hypothetical protein DFH29DRAFT_947158 [Suillus ampliporus]|nr:hypothetical protein DFH29DRAFT_947158 [Suillus ampliporus]
MYSLFFLLRFYANTVLISHAMMIISLRLRGLTCGKSESETDIRFVRCTSQHSGESKATTGVPPSESSEIPSAGCTCQGQ